MPARRKLTSLSALCLDNLFETLFDLLHRDIPQEHLNNVRYELTRSLPPVVRQRLLNMAIMKDRNRIQYVMDLIGLLCDHLTSDLCPTYDDGFMISEHYYSLISHLKTNNCIGLRHLFIRVVVDHATTNGRLDNVVYKSNCMLRGLLANGLGQNLRVLLLQGVCDNETLRRIGLHCVQLKELDVTGSWFLNDNGIKSLCFKKPEIFPLVATNFDADFPAIGWLLASHNELNACCRTLVSIKIQRTNITQLSVILLLVLMQNLRTLGGFIYGNNVGDLIMKVYHKSKGRLKLSLNHLWDSCLTYGKLAALNSMLPDLTFLYTRANYLTTAAPVTINTYFVNLTHITVDFDFKSINQQFLQYLKQNGSTLQIIRLKDQPNHIDISRIAKYCPKLVELYALGKVGSGNSVVENDQKDLVRFDYLKVAGLRMLSPNVLTWLLLNARRLEKLEVLICDQQYYSQFVSMGGAGAAAHSLPLVFTNALLKQLIRLKPPCFHYLKSFNITLIDPCTISQKTVQRLIDLCPNLQTFGDFGSMQLSRRLFDRLVRHVRLNNFDLTLIRNGIEYRPHPLVIPSALLDVTCKPTEHSYFWYG